MKFRLRWWIFVHNVIVHPVLGILVTFSPTLDSKIGNKLHDRTIPIEEA